MNKLKSTMNRKIPCILFYHRPKSNRAQDTDPYEQVQEDDSEQEPVNRKLFDDTPDMTEEEEVSSSYEP